MNIDGEKIKKCIDEAIQEKGVNEYFNLKSITTNLTHF